MKKINVVKDSEQEIPAEVFESAIVEIGKAMKAITSTRLTRAAIAALIKDRSGYSKETINVVLNNLENLETLWLKPKAKR
jgi:hypothetical protein